jgi:hypothetical protein
MQLQNNLAILLITCRKADEIDASIICLAAHHNSSFSEFVVGSVSNRVAEHATAKPVCVIKGHKVDSIAESRGIIV